MQAIIYTTQDLIRGRFDEELLFEACENTRRFPCMPEEDGKEKIELSVARSYYRKLSESGWAVYCFYFNHEVSVERFGPDRLPPEVRREWAYCQQRGLFSRMSVAERIIETTDDPILLGWLDDVSTPWLIAQWGEAELISPDALIRHFKMEQSIRRVMVIGMSIIGGAYLILAIFNNM